MMKRYKVTLEERLARRTMKTSCGCWIWLGLWNDDGYGKMTIKGKAKTTHRLAYELFRGEIPNGLQVLHTCDVPSCVNPVHLFLGTHDDNMKDAARKGRLRGRNCIDAKKVAFIKDNPQLTQREVAKTLGIGVGTVCRYRNMS